MSHDEVVTIFHEFGHAMHTILTQAKYARFSGTSVPRDFVEAPSQMLENWAWDKTVLDSFAADYRDPSKKIPPAILDQLKVARLATEGTHYRGQLGYGLMDLTLHTQINASNTNEVVPLSNKILSEVVLPVPPGHGISSPTLATSSATAQATTVTPGRTPSRRTWRRCLRIRRMVISTRRRG